MTVNHTRTPLGRVWRAAEDRHGVISRGELLALGIAASQVDAWVKAGRLRVLFRGVYAVAQVALRPQAWWLGAVLAAGSEALLAGASTVQLHGYADPSGPAHVVAPRALRPQRRLVAHRGRVAAPDRLILDAVPTTTLERALVDLAGDWSYASLRAVADRPRRLDHVALRRLGAHRLGAEKIDRLVAGDEAHTRSELERLYLPLERALGLPPGERNVRVAGHTVDVHYAGLALCVELDGRAHHDRRAQMTRDRHRDLDYQGAGQAIARLMWDDLHPDARPATVARMTRLITRRAAA